MTGIEIIRRRLCAQRIIGSTVRDPREMVEWMVAMQAQEYAMARWAIGLRVPGATDATIEAAFNAGEILRTHVLRPTWHFVSPADIRWLVQLTAPRVRRLLAGHDRRLGIDRPLLRRSHRVLEKAFAQHRFLSRDDLRLALERARISATGQRLAHLMMHAELDALICSGPRQGRQFTYALLDQRAPHARALEREEALIELARRFVASRGPVSAQDFAYWSGLTVNDAKSALAALPLEFSRVRWANREHFFRETPVSDTTSSRATFLMPDYDEYGASYRDRELLRAPRLPRHQSTAAAIAFNRMIIVDGRIVGTWRREVKAHAILVETDIVAPLSPRQQRALRGAVQRFRSFVNASEANRNTSHRAGAS